MSSNAHNLHVPLDASQHAALRVASRRLKRPATALVREAVADWLRREERAKLDQELESWARAHADTAADLDADLEAAGVAAVGDSEL